MARALLISFFIFSSSPVSTEVYGQYLELGIDVLVGTGVLLDTGVAVAGSGVLVGGLGVRLGVSVGSGVFGVLVLLGVLDAGGVVFLMVGFGVEDALEEICTGAV